MMLRLHFNYKYVLVWLLFFLGPMGMFLTPFPGIGSLRTFYFISAFLTFLAFLYFKEKNIEQYTCLFLLSSVVFASASYALLSYQGSSLPIAINPLVRFIVIFVLMFGFYMAAMIVADFKRGELLEKIIEASFWGFCLVFLLGGALYFLYTSGVIGRDIYTRFVTLDQQAYGYVRLSPGTYPNEFGIICSFYAIYALCRYGKTYKLYNLALALLFVCGVFLASTRAAYVTLAFGLLAITFLYPKRIVRIQYLIVISTFLPLVLIALSYISFNVIEVVTVGFDSLVNGSGSSQIRENDWKEAIDDLMQNISFGVGFESPYASTLHNVPLQLLYGFGAVPIAVVALLLFAFYYAQRAKGADIVFNNAFDAKYMGLLRLVLAAHVFLFALTNHNQTHFFTWALFFLTCFRFKVSSEENLLSNERQFAR